jgi:hypothetical protein
MFARYCENGDLEAIEQKYCCRCYVYKAKHLIPFQLAAKNGHTHIFEWAKYESVSDLATYTCAKIAIKYNQNETALCIINNYEVPYMGRVIIAACKYDNTEIIKTIDKKYFINPKKIFRNAINYCRFDIAKWLVTENIVGLHHKHDKFYKEACKEGRLDIAKWIIETGIDNTLHPEFAQAACKYDNLENLEWILSISKNIDIEKSFTHACFYGNVNIMEWLSNNYDITDYPNLFTKCQHKSTDQWFMDKFRYSSTPYFWHNDVYYILNRENSANWKHVLINECDVIYYPSSKKINETAVIEFMAGLKRPKSANTSL